MADPAEHTENPETPPPAECLAASKAPATPSIGETWWHRLNYGGVGYVANLALSVVLWDFFLTGHGKPVYHGIQRGSAGLLKAMNLRPQQAESISEGVAKYIFSPLGGHITMMPVKYMEDHAGRITHSLNKTLDENYQHKNLQLPEDAPDDAYPPLTHPPNKNNWFQIYARRGIGWIAVLGAGVGLRGTGMERPLEQGTLRALNHVVDISRQSPRFQRYAQLTALDAYLTVVTSAITALTKNTFGKARNAEDELPDEALSVDVPGITQNGIGGHSHAAQVRKRDKALIPHENHTKAVQASRENTGPEHSLPA